MSPVHEGRKNNANKIVLRKHRVLEETQKDSEEHNKNRRRIKPTDRCNNKCRISYIYIYKYVYIYIYTYMYIFIFIFIFQYIYIYIYNILVGETTERVFQVLVLLLLCFCRSSGGSTTGRTHRQQRASLVWSAASLPGRSCLWQRGACNHHHILGTI